MTSQDAKTGDQSKSSSSSSSTRGASQQNEKPNPRSSARIAVVQALFQMDLARTGVREVIEEFSSTRFPTAQDGDLIKGADNHFFAQLVRGVVRRQRDLDPLIDQRLAQGWRLSRIDSTLRAILRAAAYELMERNEVPARVVINEYVNIAHVFFDGDEPKVVNGVLDGLSRNWRTGEFETLPPNPENKG